MIVHRTQGEWVTLIREFNDSSLTVAQFCKLHDLKPKTFGNVRRKFQDVIANDSPFIKLESAPQSDTSNTELEPSSMSSILLETPHCRLQLPMSTSPQWLSTLIRSMGA
ncbi:IS66 family insertion sequence element accessory protein TnpA [Vibrio mediterranei]